MCWVLSFQVDFHTWCPLVTSSLYLISALFISGQTSVCWCSGSPSQTVALLLLSLIIWNSPKGFPWVGFFPVIGPDRRAGTGVAGPRTHFQYGFLATPDRSTPPSIPCPRCSVALRTQLSMFPVIPCNSPPIRFSLCSAASLSIIPLPLCDRKHVASSSDRYIFQAFKNEK